jgi:cyclophilin family peptidyl-prolyl cis-trans isomerase
MVRIAVIVSFIIMAISCNPKLSNGLRAKDLSKDVEMVTSKGTMIIRLSDSTPLHRDNFLRLVRQHFYDSILFHRVIKDFMIQAGDPTTKRAKATDTLGEGDVGYAIPAEIRSTLFHHKGAIAVARLPDDINPQKDGSGSQFYIVQGKKFTAVQLDSIEQKKFKGAKIPESERAVYQSVGGTPHLDHNYTVFGEVIRGMEVIDSIASTPTSGSPFDKPLKEVRILKMRLIDRTNNL